MKRKITKIGLIPGGLVLGYDGLVHHGTLVMPINPIARLLLCSLGLGLGFVWALSIERSSTRKMDWRFAAALCVIPFFCAILISYIGRRSVELWAFRQGYQRQSYVLAPVIEKSRRAIVLEVQPLADSRELLVYVDRDTHDYISLQTDCLPLKIEIGRNGIERTELPTMIEPGLSRNRFVPCPKKDDDGGM